ncbi:TPA: transcriptional regulator [Serratia marcescens]
MRYIINNNVKYHEDKSELISLHDDIPPIVLTATLNRLLSALVRNNNLVLSRETLLSQVWEAHGQVASGNNLNNTISILRKAFSSLGEEDIIVTLPRQGFMFTATELKTADSLAEKLMEPVPEPTLLSQAPVSHRIKRFKSLSMAVLVMLAVVSSSWAWFDSGFPPLSEVAVGKIDNCSVRFVTSYHKPGTGGVDLEHLRDMLKQRPDIQCREPGTLFYYDTQSLAPNSIVRTRSSYFYYCPQVQMAGGKVQCENFYESWGL